MKWHDINFLLHIRQRNRYPIALHTFWWRKDNLCFPEMFDKLEPNAATGPLDQSHGHSCSGNKDTSAVLILLHQEGHLQYDTYYITIRIITYGIYQNMVYSRIHIDSLTHERRIQQVQYLHCFVFCMRKMQDNISNYMRICMDVERWRGD